VPGETNLTNNDYQDGTIVIVGLQYPPKDLVAKPMNNAVNLTWSAPDKSGVQDYYIFRGTTPNFEISWANYHAVVDGSKLQFVDTISDNTIYYYKVIASYPEGFSVPSDTVGCAKLESFEGIFNSVTGINSLSVPTSDLLTSITFQQNFFVFTGEYYSNGDPIAYWCQNVVCLGMNAFVSHARSDMDIWGPLNPFDNLGFPSTPAHRKLVISFEAGIQLRVLNEINFLSKISGSSLIMQNSLYGPWTIDLGLTNNSYIYTNASDYPPDISFNIRSRPPNFVIVGDTRAGARQANFTGGVGHVATKTKIGDKWVVGRYTHVVEEIFRCYSVTEESSIGLNWSTYGNFVYEENVEEDGVFFVPDFERQIAPPFIASLNGLGNILILESYCPIYLTLQDQFGRFVGYNSTSGIVETQIDSVMWVSNRTIYITDPSGTYNLVATGTKNGMFTLIISLQNEDGTCLILFNITDNIAEGFSKSWVISPSEKDVYEINEAQPLLVSVSPLSGSVLAGNSVTFTSSVSGGILPYSFQWYLNGAPVSEATSNTWTFTPTSSGIYYVYLKVTDATGNTKQSETARITVATVPVGGYSIPIQTPATLKPITPYLILTAILTIVYTGIKRKTTRKPKQQ